jgi:hypothetical protein
MTAARIEEKITSELFSVKSIYDMTYTSPNYRVHVLDSLLSGIYDEIDDLPLDEYLIKKLNYLINGIMSKMGDEPLLKPNTATSRAQRSHIEYLLSELRKKIVSIETDISKRKEDSKSGSTCLTRKETAILFRYLQMTNAILNHEQISDREIVKLIGPLTNISPEQIRKEYVGNSWTDMAQISAKRENYDNVRSILETIIERIKADSKPFN